MEFTGGAFSGLDETAPAEDLLGRYGEALIGWPLALATRGFADGGGGGGCRREVV